MPRQLLKNKRIVQNHYLCLQKEKIPWLHKQMVHLSEWLVAKEHIQISARIEALIIKKLVYAQPNLLEKQQIYYEATFDSVDIAGKKWAYASKAAGRGLNTYIHCVSDGAIWINHQATTFLDPDRFIVDFFHVSEYLSAAQDTCKKNDRWLKTQQNRLKKNQYHKVLSELSNHLEQDTIPKEHAPVRKAFDYINNRTQQLDYKGSIEQNLPIGSGLIESGHKHVLQSRLKIPGASWLPENAQVMVEAKVIRANQMWTDIEEQVPDILITPLHYSGGIPDHLFK